MKRQVTVYEASKNGKVTVLENVEASTLGELKAIMSSNGIDIENMDFMEGISNVVLRDDSSALPSDIPYKGDKTNNLFVYLSLKNKKIASGMDRKEAYRIIKENDLADEVKAEFGRNFTQVSTDSLIAFVNNKVKAPSATVTPKSDNVLKDAILMLIDALLSYDSMYESDAEKIKDFLNGKTTKKEPKSVFQDDIEDIVSRM